MVAALQAKLYSPEEYLALERAAEFKSEYLNGEIYAMSGGSPEHSTVGVNVSAEIHSQLKGKPCQAFSNDMKVRTSLQGLYSYPDLSVVCEQPRFHDEERDVLLNPIVIVEVLSPSTEAYDRGRKFAKYQQIKSLQNYVMISQDEPRVELYVRQPNDDWLLTVAKGLDASIALPAIDCVLLLADVYDRIRFEEPNEPGQGSLNEED